MHWIETGYAGVQTLELLSILTVTIILIFFLLIALFKVFSVKRRLTLALSHNRTQPFLNVRTLIFLIGILLSQSNLAIAEMSLEFYGGYQTSPHSIVKGQYQDSITSEELVPFRFTAGWQGKSFSMPPYYGIRFTNWKSNSGWGLDFTHSKAYVDPSTQSKTGFKLLQFTDGLNNLTIHRQIELDFIKDKISTYYGYGVGIILPHVEFQANRTLLRTFEYQYGGPTIAFNGGLRAPIAEHKFLFAEYKFTASWLDVNLSGGGSLKTRILTNALNVGLGFEF